MGYAIASSLRTNMPPQAPASGKARITRIKMSENGPYVDPRTPLEFPIASKANQPERRDDDQESGHDISAFL